MSQDRRPFNNRRPPLTIFSIFKLKLLHRDKPRRIPSTLEGSLEICSSTLIRKYHARNLTLKSKLSERLFRRHHLSGPHCTIANMTLTGSFLPVTLEQLARGQGVLYSDRSMPCMNSDATTSESSSNTQRILRRADGSAGSDDQCIISPFGHEITTASFAMYTFSLAVLVQCVVLISLGSFADYGGYPITHRLSLSSFLFLHRIMNSYSESPLEGQ